MERLPVCPACWRASSGSERIVVQAQNSSRFTVSAQAVRFLPCEHIFLEEDIETMEELYGKIVNGPKMGWRDEKLDEMEEQLVREMKEVSKYE